MREHDESVSNVAWGRSGRGGAAASRRAAAAAAAAAMAGETSSPLNQREARPRLFPSPTSPQSPAGVTVKVVKRRGKSATQSRKATAKNSKRGTVTEAGSDSFITPPPLVEEIPQLYVDAVKERWDKVIQRAASHPREAQYAHQSDGCTALHLAVMSCVYSTTKDMPLAGEDAATSSTALEAITPLIDAFPDALTVRCRHNGYTPLAYACLVPQAPSNSASDSADPFGAAMKALELSERLVRCLLEKHGKGRTQTQTRNGLTALDLHIVSFSHAWANYQDVDTVGRTTTGVLRALLEHDPTLAQTRSISCISTAAPTVPGGKVAGGSGPLDLLYSCNAQAFLSALSREEENANRAKALAQKPHQQQPSDPLAKAPQVLSAWWAWKWAIILLKYGSALRAGHGKRRGARFQAVHAAALTACPLPLLMLTVRAFPDQIREEDTMSLDGNLPLHIVSAWESRSSLPNDSTSRLTPDADAPCLGRKGTVICALLSEFPEAARIRNKDGKTPLALAVETGTTWDCGVRRLVRAFPEAVSVQDRKSSLYPFMMATATPSLIAPLFRASTNSTRRSQPHRRSISLGSWEDGTAGDSLDFAAATPTQLLSRRSTASSTRQEVNQARTAYELLRFDPTVMVKVLENMKEDSCASFSSSNVDMGWADFDNFPSAIAMTES